MLWCSIYWLLPSAFPMNKSERKRPYIKQSCNLFESQFKWTFLVPWHSERGRGAINQFTSSEKISSQVSSMFHLVDLIIWWFLAFLCWLAFLQSSGWLVIWHILQMGSKSQPACCQQQGEVNRRRRLGPSLQPGQGLTALFSLCNLVELELELVTLELVSHFNKIHSTNFSYFLFQACGFLPVRPHSAPYIITLSNTVFSAASALGDVYSIWQT